MNNHTRRFFILEIPTAGKLRRFSLLDAVADVEIEVREIPSAVPSFTEVERTTFRLCARLLPGYAARVAL